MNDELVKFRFEIPDRWIADAPIDEFGIWFDLMSQCRFVAETVDLIKPVMIVEGKCNRDVLAQIGPIVERMWRDES